jgi:dipeptidyl aminopeptidase/acylaminoacyl peptidase
VGGGGFEAVKHMVDGPVPDALLKQGFAVMATDYRKYHFGEDEVQDGIAAYRHLSALPFVDRNRVAILGTSHGGYLVLLMATRIQPAAVLSLAGTADIEELFYPSAQKAKAQIQSYDQWREMLFGGTRGAFNEIPLELAWRFGDRKELYRNISPMAYLDKVQSPVLYVVGGADNLRHSGKRFVEALQAKGKTAVYSEHAGMPHGFYNGRGEKPPQQFFDALRVMQEFLKKYLQKPDY